MKLLALDTATERCSAALWHDGEVLAREAPRAGAASEQILCLIEQLLAESGAGLAALDAIAFGRGPGAFTGVRLATGVAQGLAFAAGLPVLPVSDLGALALLAFRQPGTAGRALICQDARMGEVYWASFVRAGALPGLVGREAVGAPSQVCLPASWQGERWCGAGSGFEAHPALGELAGTAAGPIWPSLRPHAREIAAMAAAQGLAPAVSAEHALPVYLRDEVAAVPSRN
jgi:tRNA threonylcarbamoyladenosine biosynthesis protein TsaB